MKVLVCTVMAIPHIGGASTHIELLMSVLQKSGVFLGLINGNDIRVTTSARLLYICQRILEKDRARASYLTSALDRMTKRIKKIVTMDTDNLIIHCHDPLATCAALRPKLAGVSVVQTVHGPWSKENQTAGNSGGSLYNSLIQKIEKEAYAGADLLLPVDNGQSDILIRDFGIEPHRIMVNENAVDVESLADAEPVLVKKGDAPYFLVPRRLVPKNGVEFALRAFAQIDRHDIELLIAGDGQLKGSLSTLAEDLGVSSKVRFLGGVSRDKIIPLMKGSKAIIVPSIPVNGVIEATSLAVLEAMACSVPVIGSSVGGIKDIIRDETCGILVQAGNATSIATAMKFVLDMDPVRRSHIVTNAKKRVEESFGIPVWKERIFYAYRKAMLQTKLSR